MATRRAYVRPVPVRPARVDEAAPRRSHAAIPVAVFLVALGLYGGQYSLLIPGALGVLLLYSGGAFLSTRVNPLSPSFYLTRKPSWTAVAVVFLGAFALLAVTYEMWLRGWGPLLPRL